MLFCSSLTSSARKEEQMLKSYSNLLSNSSANLFKVDYNLQGENRQEFVYRYDLVDRMEYLESCRALINSLREEE